MKKLAIMLLCLTFLVGILGLTACYVGFTGGTSTGGSSTGGSSTGNPTDDVPASILTVYAEAQDLGYTGTLEDFINLVSGEDGQDGAYVTEAKIIKGSLIISLSNGTIIDAGTVVGEKGEQGAPGQDGQNGQDGAPGEDGKDGVGVQSIVINDKGELVITYTDGNEVNLGVVVGKDGENGTNGNDGENGKDGQNGQDGEDGKDGENGTNGTDGENGKDGQNGQDGAPGQNGQDGVGVEKIEINDQGELVIYYTDETFVNLGVVVGKDGENGTNGTDGENGKDGQNGQDGEDGKDGKDGVGVEKIEINDQGELVIYYTDETFVNLGVVVGKDGENGTNGTDGENGKDGQNGQDGQDGKDGVGVEKIEINENGELVIYYTNETFVNLGVVVGKDGENGTDGNDGENGKDGQDGAPGQDGQDGKDGVGVQSIVINDKGELIIYYTNETFVNLGVVVGKDGTNGTDGENGKDGENGQNGQDGKDGVGVEKIEINENGELIIYYTDGNEVNLGVVVGKDGENGTDGKDGEDGEDLTACEHLYGEWSTEREATCESIGVNIRTCTNCGVVEYEFIEEKGHLYELGYTLVNTCAERKVIYYCTTCSVAKFANEEPIEGHNIVNTVCTVCGYIQPTPDEYFIFTERYGGTYSIKAKDVNNMPAEVILPSTYNGKDVTVINDGSAFSNCSSLTSVTIPDSVTYIGYEAFSGCRSLTEIKVSENNANYKSIDGNLYTKDGKTLIQYAIGKTATSFVIPDGVTSIYNYAFSDCSSLTSITIPDSVTSIGNRAFYNCFNLTSITIGNSVTSIGASAFEGCGLYKVINNSNLNFTIGKTDNGYVTYCAKILVDKNGNITYANDGYEYIETADNFLFRKNDDGYALIAYLGNNETITLPKNINGNTYSIDHFIGGINVIIPDSVTSIGDRAFYGCSSLTNITIPDSVTYIGSGAFYGCSSLISVTIPDSVTSIGNRAFYGCSSLTSITIPEGVTSIDYYAFAGCSSLTTINFNGTMAQWNAIEKGSDWNYYTDNYTVVCTDGKLDKNGNVIA